MTEQQRAAMRMALAFTMREFATVRDFKAARAMVRDALEAALAESKPNCECHRCIREHKQTFMGLPLSLTKMILCPTCGYKRCPRASDHRLDCTGSNEPGQPGSVYAVPAEPEPVADPFADIRGKRMSELNDEQADRARERWLRDQIDPQESYWYPHLQALFRIIDRLRAAPAEPEPVQEPVAWMVYTQDGQSAYVTDNPTDLVGAYRALPLYTAPPARQTLTDSEADALAHEMVKGGKSVQWLVRAIERKITGGNDD